MRRTGRDGCGGALAKNLKALIRQGFQVKNVNLEQFPAIMRKKEVRAGSAGQGGGHRRTDARQGRQRGPAIPGPLNVSLYFGVLL